MTMRLRTLAAILALASLLLAACGGDDATAPAPSPTPAAGAYLALGDSLSFGIGASEPDTSGFVALVHQALGDGYELINLGVPGHTSQDLIDGPLSDAVDDITQRNGDSDASNDVRLITLEIGGNDLLRLNSTLVESGLCPDVESSLDKPECYEPLADVFDTYEANLTRIIDALRTAGPDVPILLLTLYNPLEELGDRGEIAGLALEGLPDTRFPDGVNDITRRAAEADGGVIPVDLYPLFQGETLRLISPDFIHPNDAGYRVMADAVLEALTPQAELPEP